MISAWLLAIVRCPACAPTDGAAETRPPLQREDNELVCPQCGARYPVCAGYLDLRPRAGLGGKTTVYADESAALDSPTIRPPVLSAGVRLWVLRTLLRPHPPDALLDIGCGNGNFAVWNAPTVAHIVGLDAAPRFAHEALGTVDLVQGDARALPFVDGTFDGVYSLDVLEHLDLAGVRGHLAETRRVLADAGAYFCFSNTRERSWLNYIIDPGRRLAERLHRAGIVDRTRDHLRKSDHVKAIATADDLTGELARAGLRIEQLWFLNPLVATYAETLGFAVVERLLAKRRKASQPETGSAAGSIGQAEVSSTGSAFDLRDRAAKQPAVRIALRWATAVLALDVVFFRGVRTGPFFLLARRNRVR